MGPTSNLTTTTVHLLICRVPGCCQMPLYPTRHMALHRPCMLAGYFLYIATQPAIATRCLPCLNVTFLTPSTPRRSVHPPPLAVADVASTVADVVADAHGCLHATNMNLLCIAIVLLPEDIIPNPPSKPLYALFFSPAVMCFPPKQLDTLVLGHVQIRKGDRTLGHFKLVLRICVIFSSIYPISTWSSYRQSIRKYEEPYNLLLGTLTHRPEQQWRLYTPILYVDTTNDGCG